MLLLPVYYSAARPSVYQPRSIEASQAPLQVDPRLRTFFGISLAAEVQPGSLHVASTRTHTRLDTPIPSSDICQRNVKPMRIDIAHPLAGNVDIGINEPTLGSRRDESQLGVIGFTEPRPTSIDVGHPLFRGVDVVRPSPAHVRPTPTSMSAGPMPAHVVYPSSVGTHVVSRPTLADDESAMRQPTSAYTGQYATVCTGLQVQTSDETLTAQSLLLLGRCPTSPQSSHSSVQEWLQTTGTHAPPSSPVESVSTSRSELQQVLAPRTEAPVVVRLSVRRVRHACRVHLDAVLHRLWRWKFLDFHVKCLAI